MLYPYLKQSTKISPSFLGLCPLNIRTFWLVACLCSVLSKTPLKSTRAATYDGTQATISSINMHIPLVAVIAGLSHPCSNDTKRLQMIQSLYCALQLCTVYPRNSGYRHRQFRLCSYPSRGRGRALSIVCTATQATPSPRTAYPSGICELGYLYYGLVIKEC